MRVIAAILFLLCSVSAVLGQDAYEFKGYRLGMSLEEFRQRPTREAFHLRREELNCAPWQGLTICGVGSLLNSPYVLGDGCEVKFYFVTGKLYLIQVIHQQNAFDSLRAAVIEKYGRPSSVTSKTYQNGFGIRISGQEVTWSNGVSKIILDENTPGQPPRVPTLAFSHDELSAKATKVLSSRRPSL